jgi:hypothetical protein
VGRSSTAKEFEQSSCRRQGLEAFESRPEALGGVFLSALQPESRSTMVPLGMAPLAGRGPVAYRRFR